MAYNKVNDIIIEGADIRYENFKGEEKRNPNTNRVINVEGNRNFCVVINHEDAQRLVDEGWNVKCKLPKEEGDEPFCYLQVAVSFKIPPKIIMVSGGEQTRLNEETIDCLSGTRFKNVDLQINPSHYDDMYTGEPKIKAYLRTGYFEIEEDVFAYKYK